jgi:hypothetical protein
MPESTMNNTAKLLALTLMSIPQLLMGQSGNFVPGSGTRLENVGDDFEEANWGYVFNLPKSTEEQNEKQNLPLGKSTNGRWYEGAKRGQPDVVQRIATPEGGLAGSQGSMLIRSLQTGIPGQPSFKMQQEDFILNVQYRTGGTIPVTQNPSVVTRVYLPPTEEWDRRSGPHFAFRVALETTKKTPRKILFMTTKEEDEVYWPGLFICMDSREQTKQAEDRVYFRVRANGQGGDVLGPEITTLGWWTLGISMSENGAVHYYARPGVEDLTGQDYITSMFPYNYKAETFRSAFFNIVNGDNGRSWTSTLIVDDTYVFLGKTPSAGGNTSQMARTRKSPAADTRLQTETRVATQPKDRPTRGSKSPTTSKSESAAKVESTDEDAYYR